MSSYTLGHHESVLRSHRWRTAENSAGYLLPLLPPGASVLDVGCGPGTITADLARLVGPSGRVLGVDTSAKVLELAADTARDAGVTNVEFAVGDIHALGIEDAAFDVVHAHQVLQHLADPVSALKEMGRVARPGGVVAARDADYAAMTWHPDSDGISRWLAVYRRAARLNDAEPDAGRRLLDWARQAGFDDVVASASVWCFATPKDREWWGGLQADRIVHSAVAEQALRASLADEAGLADMAAAWRDWAADDSAWFAVLHGEVVCRVPRESL